MMARFLLALSLLPLVTLVSAGIEELPTPFDIQQCFDLMHEKVDLSDVIGENVIARCVHGILWSDVKETPTLKVQPDTLKWFSDLVERSLHDITRTRQKRQGRAMLPRIRKEYRLLTDQERMLYHRAILMLKADRSVLPNKYDALGQMHFQLSSRSHTGPNFPGWHRMFLIVVENLLREKVPSVTIPFWDSTLDGALRDPRASIMWSPDFYGNGNGFVTTGPFRNWITPMGPLLRSFDDGGALMNWTSIEHLFEVAHLENITYPNALPKYNLEEHHNEVHRWVGGHMAPPPLAAFDPIFYSHHAFVDLIWELFRQSQRAKGIDPTTDYPESSNLTDGHNYNDYSGIGNLRNRHGLSDFFLSTIYSYQRPPNCTKERPDCGSPRLKCDTEGVRARCVSTTVFDTPTILNENGITMNGGSGIRELRSTRHQQHRRHGVMPDLANTLKLTKELECSKENVNNKFVNNFFIDGIVDKSQWVYIPIEVADTTYSAKSADKAIAIHERCKSNTSLPKRVFVETDGINYRGSFTDIFHVQNDLPTSSSIRYLGVKSPEGNVTDVFVTAYDSCGRVCRPFCQSKGGNRYRPCSGAIRLTNDKPHQYGKDVTLMAKNLWVNTDEGYPMVDNSKVFVKMLCGDSGLWPW